MFRKTLVMTFVLMVIGTAFWYANIAKAQLFVTDGLIGFWTFDESDVEGKTIKDIWGNSDGTVEGSLRLVAGKIEKALNLDGKTFVEIPKGSPVDNALIGSPSFTVEFWANVERPGPAHQAWFCKGQGDTSKAIRILCDPGGMEWGMHFWNNDWWTGVVAEDWQHIAFTFDGKTNLGQMFENGEFQLDHTFVKVDFPSSVVWFGKEIWGGSTIGKGVIDEARVYNRVLTHDEVKQNFNVQDNTIAVNAAGKLSITWGKIKASR